jgi:predicted HTH transcriptional regulator
MSGDESYEIETLGMTVVEAIDAGETPSIEYKRELPDDVSDIAKEVVALTNNGGGAMFVGVADDGTVVGLERPRTTGERIAGVVQDIQSPLDLDILEHSIRSESIISLIVPGYRHLPRAYDYRFYQRRGTTKQPLTPAEVWELMPNKG